MDILILADFCTQLKKEDNSRFLYLANMLCENHSVEVITSDFNHSKKEYFQTNPEGFDYEITMLHEPQYKKNVCLKRFYSHFIWGKNVAKYLKDRKKPDVIYCAVPTLKASYEAAKYCEKNNIRFIVDIQDLWPEAFQMVFNVPLLSNIIFAPFKYLADGIYSKADEVIAVSRTYVNRVLQVNKKCKMGHCVFLGTRLDTFDNNVENNCIQDKPAGELWLAYCGTLGSSYDLTCVFDALEILEKKGLETPRFIVMGDGPERKRFEEYAQKKKIKVSFTGNLTYAVMCGMLVACDITVNPITCGAAQSIINKHADYAASGLPVLSTQESEEYINLVNEYKMGFNCNNSDAEDLASKMEILIKDETLRKNMGKNARKCAEEKFDRKKTYYEIVEIVSARV